VLSYSRLALSVALLPFLVVTALADITVWNNGALNGDSGYCDSQNPCGGYTAPSWVADNFTLKSPAVISGFTYYDFVCSSCGSISDYNGTDWLFSVGDPHSATPIASGFSLGAATPAPFPFNSFLDTGVLVTVTGLNVPLAAGTYWLSIETQEANNDVWSRGTSSGTALPGYEFYYAGGLEIPLPSSGFPPNTAFTVESAPEPALYPLLGVGIAGLLLLRRRIFRLS
jgi:hypothetical protein